jgi:hypothetical protein
VRPRVKKNEALKVTFDVPKEALLSEEKVVEKHEEPDIIPKPQEQQHQEKSSEINTVKEAPQTRLEEMQKRQKLMEEENKRKKELLAKAIQER